MANLTILVLLLFTFTLSSAVNRKISKRMVGGSVAEEEQFPYQVSIFDLFKGHFCGGSILNERWILTAARCVRGKHESSFYIAAGIIDSSDLPDAIYVVDKVIIDDFQNLALIKLQDPLTFSNKINKINIPSKNMNIIDTSVVVPGWGSVTKGGSVSRNLLFLESKIYNLTDCKERMAKIPRFPPVTIDNICTFTRKREGFCDGDSGNPVVSGNYQVGVVLHGHYCAQGYPDISINVWNYANWIKQNIAEE